jgi:hypothetical protein
MLAASQQAFARDEFLTKKAQVVVTRRADPTKLNVDIPRTINKIGVHKATDVFDRAQTASEKRKAAKDAFVNPELNRDQREKDKEIAKHLFDFAKPKEVKPIVFPDSKIYPRPPK